MSRRDRQHLLEQKIGKTNGSDHSFGHQRHRFIWFLSNIGCCSRQTGFPHETSRILASTNPMDLTRWAQTGWSKDEMAFCNVDPDLIPLKINSMTRTLRIQAGYQKHPTASVHWIISVSTPLDFHI